MKRPFLALALALGFALPSVAVAGTQVTYLIGAGGIGGVVYSREPQYANRDFNQVWHEANFRWTVWYQDTSSNVSCSVSNTNNPTRCGSFSSNKWALAQNVTDESWTFWTAQTTEP